MNTKVAMAFMVVGVTQAFAQPVPTDNCKTDPPLPTTPAIVEGDDPLARLYIFPKHPALCRGAEEGDCKHKGYVLTGDSILVGTPCGEWRFVSFQGKKSRATGWVESSLYASARPPSSGGGGLPSGREKSIFDAACHEAAKLLNEWHATTEHPDLPPVLPSALTNATPVNQLPNATGAGVGDMYVWDIVVADARISGRAIKAVGYSSNGSLHDRFLELWDPSFRTQFRIPKHFVVCTESISVQCDTCLDSDYDDGYRSEDLVQLLGKPYFMRVPRRRNCIKLYGFLTTGATPACALRLGDSGAYLPEPLP